ncbi:hypothetical protein COCON_G00046790 [Conger conger]|uniref:G-protein coupled receptors family 1 profile domain-containing protein n=1 Tax=Conger conger TaxID=82655 RepID=A0A9Q1DUR3_CONCO|nr:hypothetical protein COCON_G00046790 [Conger conger]
MMRREDLELPTTTKIPRTKTPYRPQPSKLEQLSFKSKRTVNSIWLQNLAIADFVFVLFLPFSIDYVLRDFHWNFGLVMCKLNSFILMVNMYASVLFLTVISLDRYISVVHFTRSQTLRTVRRAWCVCCGVWAVAVAISFPSLVFRDIIQLHNKVLCFSNYYVQDRHSGAMRHMAMVIVRTVVGFLLPFSAISVSSILLAVRVRYSNSVRLPSFSRTISALVLAFFVCWVPFHIFSLMELSMHYSLHLHAVLKTGFPLATSLAFFNSCINPLLYVLLGKKVRLLLKRSCLEITKRSLREITQSISATESLSVQAIGALEEPIALTTV